MIELIEHAIAQAHLEQSKLTPEVLALEGMSSPKIRHLYNNLGALAFTYFEVGSWQGASLISACYRNNLDHGCCDSFEEFNPDGTVKKKFLSNVEKHLGLTRLYDGNCWDLDLKDLLIDRPDLYLFDGPHDAISHKRAVTHFFPMMADQFVFIVDDFCHPDFHAVKEGTMAGLEAVKDRYEVVKSWEIFEEGEGSVRWWNGTAIFLIRRK